MQELRTWERAGVQSWVLKSPSLEGHAWRITHEPDEGAYALYLSDGRVCHDVTGQPLVFTTLAIATAWVMDRERRALPTLTQGHAGGTKISTP
jgi:hypothetical protein